MWSFVFFKPKSAGDSADAVTQEFPKCNHTVDLGDKTLAVMPAEVTDAQAAVLTANPLSVPGSGKLIWFEPWMSADIQRAYQSNKVNGPSAGLDAMFG